MNRRVHLAALAVPASLVLSVALAPAALAATSGVHNLGNARRACSAGELSAAQAFVDAAITRRTTELSRLTGRLQAAPHVSAGDQDTLAGLYQQDTSGLTQLASRIDGDSTCAAVVADAPDVVKDYYVFALVVPQTWLTVSADQGGAGAARIQSTEPAVQAAIAAMPDGSAKSAAEATYADLVSHTSAAAGDFAGVDAAVLALTPQTYPTRTGVLAAQTTRVSEGASALADALSDARTLAADLR